MTGLRLLPRPGLGPLAGLLASLALLAGCAPMRELAAGPEADRLRQQVAAFCEAQAAADAVRAADLFEPGLRDAIRSAAARGEVVQWASQAGAGGCRPGRIWYLGGSRRVAEVVYDGFADRLDVWLGDAGLLSDLHYASGEPRLSRRVGLMRNTSRVF